MKTKISNLELMQDVVIKCLEQDDEDIFEGRLIELSAPGFVLDEEVGQGVESYTCQLGSTTVRFVRAGPC